MAEPTVAAVIPTHNRSDALTRCLRSLQQAGGVALAVYVVDDGSSDGTSDLVRRDFPAVHLLKGDGNLWWSGAMNLGARTAVQDGAGWVFVLNDDTEVAPDAIAQLVRRSQSAPDAIVGSKILSRQAPATLWSAGGIVRWPWPGVLMRGYGQLDRGQYDASAEVAWLPGMGTLVRAEHLRQLNYYDASHLPQYYADADLTLRARKAGYRILYEPASRIFNDTSTTGISARGAVTWNAFLRTFTDLRSQRHLLTTVHFYARHCPAVWLPVTLTWLYARHVASWVRHGRRTGGGTQRA